MCFCFSAFLSRFLRRFAFFGHFVLFCPVCFITFLPSSELFFLPSLSPKFLPSSLFLLSSAIIRDPAQKPRMAGTPYVNAKKQCAKESLVQQGGPRLWPGLPHFATSPAGTNGSGTLPRPARILPISLSPMEGRLSLPYLIFARGARIETAAIDFRCKQHATQ